ncbi:hypothetical protein HPB51_011971 [Rhipicephalus microplus]|uniref:Uncharacterized protein n=1 Tax=Rhipicephalus microplus TaxID=6941 RepID=A0A9J6F3H8_RHIMP|nr:hypothetical protein HPB51_011971 [Rhipicephalus microplus]
MPRSSSHIHPAVQQRRICDVSRPITRWRHRPRRLSLKHKATPSQHCIGISTVADLKLDMITLAVLSMHPTLLEERNLLRAAPRRLWLRGANMAGKDGEYHKADKKEGGFLRFVYNPDTKEVFGRTGLSWCEYLGLFF